MGEILRKGKAGKLTIEGGSRPRARAADAASWTLKKERAFLTALADSCNVKLAAQVAGVSTSAIYVRRGKDASFRAGWDRALAEGYARLELMMLERALHGVEKAVVLKNGETTTMREYSDRTGLALLRMHRDTARAADEGADAVDTAEATERILARLDRLAERGDVIETKSLPDRLTLIRRLLRGSKRR